LLCAAAPAPVTAAAVTSALLTRISLLNKGCSAARCMCSALSVCTRCARCQLPTTTSTCAAQQLRARDPVPSCSCHAYWHSAAVYLVQLRTAGSLLLSPCPYGSCGLLMAMHASCAWCL
jgi:hypothetical protein